MLLGAVYLTSLAAAIFFGASDPGASMTSLGGVVALFDHPNGVITGWTHFLVFDLFVGAWIGRDARRAELSHWLVLPGLVLAFVFGPLGLFTYLATRRIAGKGGWSLYEN